MAQIFISDDLLQRIQQYAAQAGQTPEEVVQEAITDLIETSDAQSLASSGIVPPPVGSAEERHFLDTLRQQAGQELARQKIVLSDEIIKDRGE